MEMAWDLLSDSPWLCFLLALWHVTPISWNFSFLNCKTELKLPNKIILKIKRHNI